MKAYGGREGRVPRAISARGKGVWLTSLPGRFTPGRGDALVLHTRLGGHRDSLDVSEKTEVSSPYRELNNYPVLQALAVSLHRLSCPGSCKENRLEILSPIQFRIFFVFDFAVQKAQSLKN